ncbi:MAG: AAA family ATPase [Sporichthyaceae bacterium]|nr:AAA family ATPase [Sporichthyaceae bacterium]
MTDQTDPSQSRGPSAVIVITGVMAAGKSTVAQLLAERLPRAAHVRGDVFRRMVVSGRAEFRPDPHAEAVAQLWARYRISASVADAYARDGFVAIVQDVILGDVLGSYLELIESRPLYLVVLAPQPDRIAIREATRDKQGYGSWTIEELDRALRDDTPRLGLWLDNSEQTPAQTVDEVLARLPEALIADHQDGRVPTGPHQH